MKCYKLTDKNGLTKGAMQWGENVSHTARGNGKSLCSDSWIHFYTNPLIAVLMNPIHGSFINARLWEAESSGEELHELLKSGCKTLTTIKEIPYPIISRNQRIAFGILCTKEICSDVEWNNWADNWLSKKDRTKESATTIYSFCGACATYICDAVTSVSDTYAAITVAYAADDVALEVKWGKKIIDFVKLAEKALTYE